MLKSKKLLLFFMVVFLSSQQTSFTRPTAGQAIAVLLTTAAVITAVKVISKAFSYLNTKRKKVHSYIMNPLIPEKIKAVISQKTSGFNLYTDKYLDLINKYPWETTSPLFLDIKKVEEDLNKTHYGLAKVKKNIIETIAMQQVAPEIGSKIICLIGPSGTGKTTIAQSIAKTLNKKFYSINAALSETDLRGINATYIGADAGAFTKAMITTSVKNPLILLDEIDKLNPISLPTFLEALDPERNSNFQDTFLGFGIDLSHVFFIATANNITAIPLALRDRMEMIHIDAYSQEEKVEIAKSFILPQMVCDLSLPKETIEQIKAILPELINLVSKSSNGSDGVRNLKTALKQLVASQVKTILATGQPFSLTPETLKNYIDPRFTQRHLPDPVDVRTYCDALLKDIKIPDDIFERIKKKVSELAIWQGAAALTTSYIEWVVKFPFNTYTATQTTLQKAREELDKTHYGIENVKELIIDYLAGILTSSKNPSKILCLEGMPGIGKTTIAESIATALGKKFVKISFGSITSLAATTKGYNHDEAPGPLAKAIILAKALDAVLLFDELEKAPEGLFPELIEVLDPSQNTKFYDRYLGFNIDLSKITFIASVNELSRLPSPLRDRMQICKMHPYSKNERIQIGKNKLVPEIAKNMNFSAELEAKLINLVEPIVSKVIRYEAGVRNLKRALTIAAEKYARQILELNEATKSLEFITTLSATDVLAAIEPELLQDSPAEIINTKDCVGRANGMYAGGYNGGGIFKTEVLIVPNGNGSIIPNKLAGDTEHESRNRVFAYVKSIAEDYKIALKKLTEYNVIFGDQNYSKSDGPSGGVVDVIVLVSAFTNRTIKQDFAITGAIDMHGNTLPVGGYRDKILGSEQAGIKNIIVPECSRATIEAIRKDFPDLNIFYVSTVPQALELVLNPA